MANDYNNAHAHDYDVQYMERTRNYYRAQGYSADYQWAHHKDTPFQPLNRRLRDSKVAIISTSMPDTELGREQRAVYSTPIDPIPASAYTAELSWHHSVTHTDDVGSFLPIAALKKLSASGVIGSIASNFFSLPTEYSQRNTLNKDGPDILKRCQSENVDVAILVPL
jgi:D-proline reductase (dithiol) PrdB